MALDNAKNFAKVTVSTGYDASATSIALTTGHGAKLPTAPFNAVWWNASDYGDPSDDPNVEIVRVTAKSTDTLTVTRAQESTSASTKNTSGKTYKMIAGLTAKVINTDIPGAGGTKEFFVPAIYKQSTSSIAYAAMRGDFPLTDQAANNPANFAFFMPHDFISLTSAEMVMIPDTTETIQWDCYVSFAAIGEAYNVNRNSDLNRTQAVTIDVLTSCDITQGNVFNGIAANDYVGVVIDSNTSNIRILGLKIKYS